MSGGIEFLFTIFSVPLKITFSNRKLTKIDNVFSNLAMYLQSTIVSEYAKFDLKEFSYYISKDKLFIKDNKIELAQPIVFSKQDCRNFSKNLPKESIQAIACNKLLDERESYQWWLTEQIESVNKDKNALTLLAYLYLLLGSACLFSLIKYLFAEKKVRDYRASSGNS